MKTYIFDIETAPLEQSEIMRFAPEFKADSRLKDPVKITEDLRSKQEKFASSAALNPLTAQICAMGLLEVKGKAEPAAVITQHSKPEVVLLQTFIDVLENNPVRLISFNGWGFDLPFICRRALLYGYNLFSYFFKADGGIMYASTTVAHQDLAAMWDCRRKDYVSLRDLARFLEVGDKPADGPLFYETLKTNPRAAEAYLANDLKLTFAVAKKWGLLK